MTKYDRYLAIVHWARSRYTSQGFLIVKVGNVPSKYTLIERAAAAKYLGCVIN